MFLKLRELVSGYTKLAIKYDPRYQRTLETIENGTWVGVGVDDRNEMNGLKLLTTTGDELSLAEILHSVNLIKSGAGDTKGDTGGLRERLKKRFRLLDWALFDYKRLLEVVQEQEKWTLKLRNLMQFALLPGILGDIPELQSLTTTENQRLGLSRLAETRLAILGQLTPVDKMLDVKTFEDLDKSALVLHPSASKQLPHGPPLKIQPRLIPKKILSDHSIVLVEYKTYQPPAGEEGLTGTAFEITHDRIKYISQLLSVGHTAQQVNPNGIFDGPASLKCRGYFHDHALHRFGMVFTIPPDYHPIPISLHAAITTCTRDTRPTLGQRFVIASSVGRALLEWFLVNWVHKSISSMDVNFFRRGPSHQWNFSKPYLGGFEYARPSEGVSNEIYGPWDFHQAIYRHPARQGAPTEGFHKHHDIYAFGVLLLEIGLWQVAQELFSSADQASKVKTPPRKVKDILVANASKKLGHYMGERYKEAVLACLEAKKPKLGVTDDDEGQGKLLEAFKKIVEELEAGVAVL